MAKLTRVFQKIFASTPGLNQISQFGSLKAAAPAFSTDPTVIQALGNFLTGWYGAVLGNNSPAIQDMNAICFLMFRQLAYFFQAGIAEWDTSTTYYIGSIVNDTAGVPYTSIADNNTGNALTDSTKWRTVAGYTTDISTLNIVVPVGKTYFQPNPTIPVGKTWTVQSGASLSATGPLTVAGTLIVAGTARIIG